jgi:hypothetical protein
MQLREQLNLQRNFSIYFQLFLAFLNARAFLSWARSFEYERILYDILHIYLEIVQQTA